MRIKGIVFTGKTIPLHPLSKGKVLEWLKRHAWKACKRQKRFAGSNPVLSAYNQQITKIRRYAMYRLIFVLWIFKWYFKAF